MYHAAYATLFGSLDQQLQQFAVRTTSYVPVSHQGQATSSAAVVVKATKDLGECAICKEVMVKGIEIQTTNCAHTYHEKCIKDWFKVKRTCPVCRTEQ